VKSNDKFSNFKFASSNQKIIKSLGPSGSQLQLMLQNSEAKAKELTLTWIDKWNTQEQNNMSATAPPQVRSKRFASGFIVQSDTPYLVSLNDDPMSSEIMIYNVELGETLLGCDESACEIGNFISLANMF